MNSTNSINYRCLLLIAVSISINSSCAVLKKDTAGFYLQRAEEKISKKDFLSAISDLQKSEKKDSKKTLTPKSLFLMGQAYFQYSVIYRENIFLFGEDTKKIYLNYLKQAQNAFTRIINEYPKSDLADDAQFNIGLIYDWDKLGGVNNFPQALIEYQKVIDNHPGSSAYPLANERIKLIKSFYNGLEGNPHDIK